MFDHNIMKKTIRNVTSTAFDNEIQIMEHLSPQKLIHSLQFEDRYSRTTWCIFDNCKTFLHMTWHKNN